MKSNCRGRNSRYSLKGFCTVLRVIDGWWLHPRSCNRRLFGKPWCPNDWTRGAQQDSEPHQKSFLVAWYVEHRGGIRSILSGLPVGEIRPQEKGGCTAANFTTRAEMAADYDRLGYWFAKVWGEKYHRHICGSSLKDGSLCSMYKGNISGEIRSALHRSCVQTSWSTGSHYLKQRSKVHQPLLEGIVLEARNRSQVHHGFPPADGWPVGGDDQSTGKLLEAICWTQPSHVGTVAAPHRVHGKQCSLH